MLVPVDDAAGPLLELLAKRTEALAVGDGSKAGVEVGPLVTADHRKRVAGYIEKGVAEGQSRCATAASTKLKAADSSWAHDFRPRQAGHDHRQRGNFGAGSFGDSRQNAG